MDDQRDKLRDQKIEGANQAVPAKKGEVSDAELDKVAGGGSTEQIGLNYGGIKIEYQQ